MTKPTKWHARPAKSQISLGIRLVWSKTSLSAWRKLASLATHWAHSDDWLDWADVQTDLIFAGRTVILLLALLLFFFFFFFCRRQILICSDIVSWSDYIISIKMSLILFVECVFLQFDLMWLQVLSSILKNPTVYCNPALISKNVLQQDQNKIFLQMAIFNVIYIKPTDDLQIAVIFKLEMGSRDHITYPWLSIHSLPSSMVSNVIEPLEKQFLCNRKAFIVRIINKVNLNFP